VQLQVGEQLLLTRKPFSSAPKVATFLSDLPTCQWPSLAAARIASKGHVPGKKIELLLLPEVETLLVWLLSNLRRAAAARPLPDLEGERIS